MIEATSRRRIWFNLRTLLAVMAGCSFVAFVEHWLISLGAARRTFIMVIPWAIGSFAGIYWAARSNRSSLLGAVLGGLLRSLLCPGTLVVFLYLNGMNGVRSISELWKLLALAVCGSGLLAAFVGIPRRRDKSSAQTHQVNATPLTLNWTQPNGALAATFSCAIWYDGRHEIPQAANRVLGSVRDYLSAADRDLVRSYWRLDYYHGFIWTSTATKADGRPQAIRWPNLLATSRQGRFYIFCTPQYIMTRDGSTVRESLPIDKERADLLRNEIGFELGDIQTPWLTRYSVASLYWAPLALAVGGASVPWIRLRFSLRTLLFATTLVAVLLGAVIYAVK